MGDGGSETSMYLIINYQILFGVRLKNTYIEFCWSGHDLALERTNGHTYVQHTGFNSIVHAFCF